jgi:hypothetical protein
MSSDLDNISIDALKSVGKSVLTTLKSVIEAAKLSAQSQKASIQAMLLEMDVEMFPLKVKAGLLRGYIDAVTGVTNLMPSADESLKPMINSINTYLGKAMGPKVEAAESALRHINRQLASKQQKSAELAQIDDLLQFLDGLLVKINKALETAV